VASSVVRTLAAVFLPAVAIVVSWGRLEDPRQSGELVLVALLALVPLLGRSTATRLVLAGLAFAAAAWIAFGSEPWELLPYRNERVIGPFFETFGLGVGDYYDIVVPFDPSRRPEMHGVLALAIFGFVAAIALLVAARQPLAAAAVTVAGAGWPATLIDDGAVAVGTLALAGALSIALILRARSTRTLVGGIAVGALVVGGAAWASSATSFTREAVVDWQAWNVRGPAARALGVRFVWDAQYDGIAFPPTATEVLRISGTQRAQYWRASTLDEFIADRWYEDPSFVLARGPGGRLVLDELTPDAARDEANWLEQQVVVGALVDERLVAAGTPVAVEAPSLGTLFTFPGGIVRAQRTLPKGTRYKVWSYVPDPAPAALDRVPARYPEEARRFLALWGRELPRFGAPNRARRVNAILDDPSYSGLGAYRPLFERAREVSRGAKSPYAAVLALESWLRQRGGFRYDEQPPRSDKPPLIHFVTTSRAGYCQHFAGAMAVMARLLGVPARVAFGFTSGRLLDGVWSVSDHNAHAWVEVWFAGHGWVPFDPTPGRGTFTTSYSFASNSPATVEALRRGGLSEVVRAEERADLVKGGTASGGRAESDRPSILTLALALVALGLAAIGLVKWLRRRLGYLTSDPRRVAAATRNELEWFLRDQGVAVPRSATLDDLRRAVGEELGYDAGPFVAAAGRARFGAPADTRPAATRARKELQSLLRAARAELSVAARARGLVSLRSLRGWQG
jgi:protein-glutamine gamma-glutamyltransferase